MATTFTSRAKLQMPATADRNWDTPVNANTAALDACNAVGGLCVAPTEVPSAGLTVGVAPGSYRKADGTAAAYAGAGTFTVGASATTYLWLTDGGTLTSGGAFPAGTLYVPLAAVTAGSAVVTGVADARVSLRSLGVLDSLPLAAGDAAATVVVHCGNTHGVQFGVSTDKLSFFGAAPVTRPTVTGSRGGNAALQSLLAALAALGLVTDSSS